MSNTRTKPTSISIERTQYRVGHGGFHTAIIRNLGQSEVDPFVYVYDVGAKPKKANVRAAINRFVHRLKVVGASRVQYVVLSHIDEDHVNCLEYLLDVLSLEDIAVGTVLLPWLSPAEKLIAKAHANHRGPSTVIMNLAGDDHDTVTYLAQLGVEETAFLIPDDSDTVPPDSSSPIDGREVPAGARLIVSGTNLVKGTTILWNLVAMRMQPPPGTIDTFINKLGTSSGLKPDDFRDHPNLLTQHRRKIASAMGAAAADVGFTGYGQSLTNWSCISLFGSSPRPTARRHRTICASEDFETNCDHGWLHTGDLPLHINLVWRHFEAAWKPWLGADGLCAVTAPHHGSPVGHNHLLYRRGFKPRFAIFSTGVSAKSVPGRIVYSHRNAPEEPMRIAALTATVVELHNN